MERLGSVNAFGKWQRGLKRALDRKKKQITICGGTGCTAFGSPTVERAFRDELAGRGLDETVSVKRTGCHGFCEKGPVVVILPQGIFYPNVQVEDVGEIIDETVVGGRTIRRLLYVDPVTGKRIAKDTRSPSMRGRSARFSDSTAFWTRSTLATTSPATVTPPRPRRWER